MRKILNVHPLLAVAVWLIAGGDGFAADLFAQPYYAGGYAPAPNVAYAGYGQVHGPAYSYGRGDGARERVRMVYYRQGYDYGGYQYPAGGYGGGDYRRAAYSAADVYVGFPPPAFARSYALPRPGWRPYAYGSGVPVGLYDAPGYRPHGVPHPRRHCRALY